MKHTEKGIELDPCKLFEMREIGKWCTKKKYYVSNVSCYYCQLNHENELGLDVFVRMQQEKKKMVKN